MNYPRLFMLLLGASIKGRNTEQHDVFFGIGHELKDLVPAIRASWPEAGHQLHIDAWREVTRVDGSTVVIIPAADKENVTSSQRLFFINLGGYRKDEFDELHYKMLVAARDKGEAIQLAKRTAFYKHTGFKGATSHIDDKYGVDVDDLFEISDILPRAFKQQYHIHVSPSSDNHTDEIHLGYFRLDKL